ncbi:endonuclease domain-containing protein [Solimonas fluminis]
MWYLLRDRRFFGLKFRRQHPVQPYVLDFFCQELSLAVELDGGQHNEGNNVKRDKTRSAELARRGIQVARYWNDEVLKQTESVLEDLMLRVQQLGLSLTPDPSPEGRGGARQ